MLQLRWDDELARAAEAKALLCADELGSLNVHVIGIWTVDLPDLGISMHPQKTDDQTAPVLWRFVVRDWFDQNILFPTEHVANFVQTSGTEQFVQLAAADTYAVRCSYTRNIMPKMVLPQKYLNICVCLSGPRALLVGKPLYYAAPYCSLCPKDTICDVPSGLFVLRSWKPPPPPPGIRHRQSPRRMTVTALGSGQPPRLSPSSSPWCPRLPWPCWPSTAGLLRLAPRWRLRGSTTNCCHVGHPLGHHKGFGAARTFFNF
ncbi:hypothetical protein HPB51_027009 [Rhipicephalus microplus]|uniref:Uncharacterized protein n=1 Tax=Rhipicephalus microplus TaxID=6941 RepID=A0A9J6D1G6_RHIMP|nr:hypothetical protein HPB51_027009 [Rhipicephalus microplus]